MKMNKDERDAYVLENYSTKTNKQLGIDTGWSETTIKSVKTRLGLVKSTRQKELEEYILANNIRTVDEVNNAAMTLGCRPDKLRDIMKALGVFDSVADKAFESLKKKYDGAFIFIGEYKGTKHPIEIQCVRCGTSHLKRPNDLVTYNFKCVCTREEYKLNKINKINSSKERLQIEKIEARFRELTQIYPLVQAILPDGKVEIKCSNCLSNRVINRSTLTGINPQTCQQCAVLIKQDKSAKYWKDFLASGGIEVIKGEVVSGISKVTVRRSCGHEASVVLGGLKLYNCQSCKVGDEHYFYILYLEEYGYKVGRSINVEKRIQDLKKYINSNITVAFIAKGTYDWAKNTEELILNKYREYKVFNTAVFPGATEILDIESIEEIVKYINNN